MKRDHVVPEVLEVLNFEHPDLIERLQLKVGLSLQDAEELFMDTKKFLFLCAKYPGQLTPPLTIDEGWHNFILFTRDYERFCFEHFGRFIHHQPHGRAQSPSKASLGRTLELARCEFGLNLTRNWHANRDAGNCQGSTNCQDPAPADCSPNG